MILGKIVGKITPSRFKFSVDAEVKQFDYVQVYHKDYDYVLCQIIELTRDDITTTAQCVTIGYKSDTGQIKSIRSPFKPGSEVLIAEDKFIQQIIQLDEKQKGAFIGRLEGRNIDIHLNLKELLTKHVAVLAKSGAGKSYTVGVLLEEIMEQKVPLLIIDPHGEYSSLANKNPEEQARLALFKIKAKGYNNIIQYGDQAVNKGVRPLLIDENLSVDELIHILPGKTSSAQLGMLHNAVQDRETIDFHTILAGLAADENNAKWTLISHLEHLQRLKIFSTAPTEYSSMIKPGKATIINLKGIPPDVQQIVVYKLMKDLFELRKKEKVPPFFTVIEEAHNYCPERSFGETKCSKILRTVASEGRKFGLGLCVVSQRPARVDKSVLSQCTTQIILKVTNPNDLKAVINSVEGINSESEREIQNLAIGTALVTGVVDVPLFVEIRPRKSEHGGQAAEMLDNGNDADMLEQLEEYEKEILPVIRPKMTLQDIKLMGDPKDKVDTVLVPAIKLECSSNTKKFTLLVELIEGALITEIEKKQIHKKFMPPLFNLSRAELAALERAVKLRRFMPTDIEQSALDKLKKRKLVIPSANGYEINGRFVFTSLDKLNMPYKVDYTQVLYLMKLEKKTEGTETIKAIKRFTEVTDSQECWIVHYVINN